jgi:hypothetical protein
VTDAHQLGPLAVERTHIELYIRWFERQVGSINTVCHGISVLASFYRWLVQSGLLDTTPIAAVRSSGSSVYGSFPTRPNSAHSYCSGRAASARRCSRTPTTGTCQAW